MKTYWGILLFFISGCCALSDLNEEFWRQFEDDEMLAIDPAQTDEQRHFTNALNEELPFQDLATDELFWDQFQHNLELPPPARSLSPDLPIEDYSYPSWVNEEPEEVPSQWSVTQPLDFIPQTPGTLLTSALGDLNFLSPSVFSADINPFDSLFGTLSVPTSTPIQNPEFLDPTLPTMPSTSPEHVLPPDNTPIFDPPTRSVTPEHVLPPDNIPIFVPPTRSVTPEVGPSHIQDGKITKPRSRRRIDRTPSDSQQPVRGRSMPNQKTKDRPWQCDNCQRTFARQGKTWFVFFEA